eukprot:8922408-Karenia_brevis.AAC.1
MEMSMSPEVSATAPLPQSEQMQEQPMEDVFNTPIARLMSITHADITEIYSPPRVTKENWCLG